MGDASNQEFNVPEIPKVEIRQKIETAKPLPNPEINSPKTFTFGDLEVKENLDKDLLTSYEKILYAGGLEMLKDVTSTAENNVIKMVLTNPDISSGIVGLQPLVSVGTGEAIALYQAYRHACIDFNQDYSFLEFGKERNYLKIFMNDRAAENTLKTYQKELGLSLPDRQLQKNEIISYATSLLNNPDVKKANLAHGLLSGFPLKDCEYWINDKQTVVNAIPQLKKVENLDNRFLQETPIPGSSKTLRIDPIPLLNPEDYEMNSTHNQFLPDTRAGVSKGMTRGVVEGFGLRWATPFPPQETTIEHAQKILQVDRNFGLLDFINQQRNTFNVADNIKAINIGKDILNETTGLGKASGPLGMAFGIFSAFVGAISKTASETTQPIPHSTPEQPNQK